MRKAILALLLTAPFGAAMAEPMIPEALARQVVETKAEMVYQRAELCFLQMQIMMSGHAMHIKGVDVKKMADEEEDREVAHLLLLGAVAERPTDELFNATHEGCMKSVRKHMKTP